MKSKVVAVKFFSGWQRNGLNSKFLVNVFLLIVVDATFENILKEKWSINNYLIINICQEWVNVSLFAKECNSTTQQLPRTNNHQNIGISRFKKETGHTFGQSCTTFWGNGCMYSFFLPNTQQNCAKLLGTYNRKWPPL